MSIDASSLPVLYTFRRCPYAMRARLALWASQMRCEQREVDLKQKPAHMLSLSPKGTVPVLWLASEGSRVIEESLEIMLWALRLNDPLGWLSPTHASEQEVNELIQMNDQHFKYHLDRYKYPVRYGLDSGLHHRERALQVLRELNQRLEQRAYLAGSHFSLLDAALAPFVRQFAKTDLNWFKAQTPAFTKLINWLNGFEAMSAFEWVMRKNEGHSPLLPQHAST